MGFPYVFEDRFETGTSPSLWDSVTDGASPTQVDFPSYRDLGAMPGNYAPYSGAYCMRVTLRGVTDEAYAVEGDINMANGETHWIAFRFYIGEDFTATVIDTFMLFEAISSGSTTQAVVGILYDPSTDIFALTTGQTVAASPVGNVVRGKWYTIELKVVVDTGGAGTLDAYLTPEDSLASETANVGITGITHAAVTTGHLGTKDVATTTSGTILFDHFVHSLTDRVYPYQRRFREDFVMTQSGHAFVGPGKLASVELLSGGATNNVLTVMDTDTAETTNTNLDVLELKNTVANELVSPNSGPISVHHGCYVKLEGTNPRARVCIKPRVAFGSPAAIRDYARHSR